MGAILRNYTNGYIPLPDEETSEEQSLVSPSSSFVISCTMEPMPRDDRLPSCRFDS